MIRFHDSVYLRVSDLLWNRVIAACDLILNVEPEGVAPVWTAPNLDPKRAVPPFEMELGFSNDVAILSSQMWM